MRPTGEAVFSRRVIASVLALAALLAVLVQVLVWGGDGLYDSLSLAFYDLSAVPWQPIPLLLLLSVVHYLCAAATLKAASGHRLPLYDTTLTQVAAAAADRFTPAGLGAFAVNTRYLTRNGLTLPGAVTAVSAVKVAGGLAHITLLAAVVAVQGGSLHLPISGRFSAALAIVIVLAASATALHPRCRRAYAEAAATLIEIGRDPRRLGALLVAAAGTPAILGTAYAYSLIGCPGGPSPSRVGPLMIAYLVGSALGAAVPIPSGVGSGEAALTAAAIGTGVPAPVALQGVLLFRAVTFWLPLPIGLIAAKKLRRTGAL